MNAICLKTIDDCHRNASRQKHSICTQSLLSPSYRVVLFCGEILRECGLIPVGLALGHRYPHGHLFSWLSRHVTEKATQYRNLCPTLTGIEPVGLVMCRSFRDIFTAFFPEVLTLNQTTRLLGHGFWSIASDWTRAKTETLYSIIWHILTVRVCAATASQEDQCE
jgi:hypothetical protein